MTLEADAGQIIVDGSRGEDTRVRAHNLNDLAGGTDALRAASERQASVVYGTRLAVSQAETLREQIAKTVIAAAALKANLEAVKATATTDLDNPTAGDTAITALGTLLTALAAALTGTASVSTLTYTSYRDA